MKRRSSQLRVVLRGISPLISILKGLRSSWYESSNSQSIARVTGPVRVAIGHGLFKGYHSLRFRSPFGDLGLRSPRWFACSCEDSVEPGKLQRI